MKKTNDWLITHDYAHAFGGAERCTAAMAAEVLPDAEIWVLGGNSEVTQKLSGLAGISSLLKVDRLRHEVERMLIPVLYPLVRAIPATDMNILASSYAIAHLRRTKAKKIIYCHSPFRQIYSGVEDYFGTKSRFFRYVLNVLLYPFRYSDRKAAGEADVVIATNQIVAERVRKYWKREPAAIIPPPIDTVAFHPVADPTRDYYVWLGRIVEPYKRLSLVIETFRNMPEKLIVVGDGRDRADLERQATANVEFVGNQSGEELNNYLANAKALIFPSSDDFGMVPLEAMAAGTPVIGYSGGGAQETVTANTGLLFDDLSPVALQNAIREASEYQWSVKEIRAHALKFGSQSFTEKMREVLGLATESTTGSGSN